MRFDRSRFYAVWRREFGVLSQGEVAAVNQLLDAMEADPELELVAEAAYLLATVYWETARTMRPIPERRAKPGTRIAKLQDRYWSSGFYGRGYVQLTWKRNYRAATERLRALGFDVDLVAQPDLALEPRYAYPILAGGMRDGDYGGGGLRQYVEQDPPDYEGARACVNGVDHAEEIAEIARQFETVVQAATWPL